MERSALAVVIWNNLNKATNMLLIHRAVATVLKLECGLGGQRLQSSAIFVTVSEPPFV